MKFIIFVLLLPKTTLSSKFDPETPLNNSNFYYNYEFLEPPFLRKKVKMEYFQQRLDHFDPTNLNVWTQKYFVNEMFFDGKRTVFLKVAGEVEATEMWMTAGAWSEYAKIYKALMFQLEHRYYGSSQPFGDLTFNNLKFLSTRQALEDVASFITAMNQKYNLYNVRWIAFGGSYAGTLVAWVRLKYPHLVAGAVASSAPIVAKLNVEDYFRIVADGLATYSSECLAAVKTAFDQLENEIMQPTGANLTEALNLCANIKRFHSESDIATLFEMLATQVAKIVQYTTITKPDLEDLCGIMKNNTGNTGELESLSEAVRMKLNSSCVNNIYKTKVNFFRNESISGYNHTSRQYMYQICTELGWHYSSSDTGEVFGNRFPIEIIGKLCENIFGPQFSMDYIVDQTRRTNAHYGGYDIDVRNVIFVHGSYDPVHVMGITNSSKPEVTAIFIQGESHCSDVYSSYTEDSQPLTEARKLINATIARWLGVFPRKAKKFAVEHYSSAASPNPISTMLFLLVLRCLKVAFDERFIKEVN